MKVLLTIISMYLFAMLMSCDMRSDTAKKEMEKFSGTPTPTFATTPEQTPIPADEIVQVDTSLDGDILTVNDEPKKSLNCTKYNQVAVNANNSEVNIKGVCQKITVNGDNNQITADAAMSFVFFGNGNKLTYSRFANGKQPVVIDSQAGNTTQHIAVAPINNSSNTAKQ